MKTIRLFHILACALTTSLAVSCSGSTDRRDENPIPPATQNTAAAHSAGIERAAPQRPHPSQQHRASARSVQRQQQVPVRARGAHRHRTDFRPLFRLSYAPPAAAYHHLRPLQGGFPHAFASVSRPGSRTPAGGHRTQLHRFARIARSGRIPHKGHVAAAYSLKRA